MASEPQVLIRRPWQLDIVWPGRSRSLELIAIVLLLLAVVLAQQIYGHAYVNVFGDDEASHYISSLLVHDYLKSLLHGQIGSPVSYIVQYQGHYPLIGIGHWPPLYYGVTAIWMFVFGCSRESVLMLSALVTAATGAVLYGIVTQWLGRMAGLAAAILFVAAPLVEAGSCTLMLDVPLALVSLWAALGYARYLKTGRARDAVVFGILATAGLLTKGNGAFLALLPPFAVIIGRRFELLRQWTFWLPLPLVLILAGPWTVATYGLVAAGWRFTWGWHYLQTATAANATILLTSLGGLIVVAALGGLIAVIVTCWRTVRSSGPQAVDGRLVCIAALLMAVWVFQSMVPAAIQDRYLAAAVPPLVALAIWGAAQFWAWIAGRAIRHPRPGLVAAAVLLLSMIPNITYAVPPSSRDLMAAAREIWARHSPGNPVVLIAGDGPMEAAMIAELAMRDPRRPSLFAVRGSRLLGGGGYNNADYRPRYHAIADIMAAIDDYAIPLVLLRTDHHAEEWTHLQQIRDAIQRYPNRWERIWQGEDATPVALYRVIGNGKAVTDVARLVALSGPHALK